jgi:AraC family transcriptional regulator of adaptative response/methylated-DNA-[protein]-cysteine methyltransferase
VIREDGDLAGYRWGIERKRELLARERAAAAEGDGDASGRGRDAAA